MRPNPRSARSADAGRHAEPAPVASELAAIVHLSLGIALAALLVVHIGAALRHHFVRRDEVLTRMLPTRRPAS